MRRLWHVTVGLVAVALMGCLQPIVEPADVGSALAGDGAAADDAAELDAGQGGRAEDAMVQDDTQAPTPPDTDQPPAGCDPPCPPWQACQGGGCGVKTCGADSECNADPLPAGEAKHWCFKGKCQGYQCAVDADCKSGQTCSKLTYECNDPPKGCTSVAQCDDKDACTVDSCTLAGQCEHKAIGGCCAIDGDCNDNDACTLDKCVSGKCSWTPQGKCCKADAECDDKQPCTQDLCNGGVCAHKPAVGCCLSNAECDDNNPASSDSCVQGKCAYGYKGLASSCAGGASCSASACTSASCVNGTCSYSAPKTGGGCCTLDSQCTKKIACKVDSCQGLQCVSQPAVGKGTHQWHLFDDAQLGGWTVEKSSQSVYFHFDTQNKIGGAGSLRYGVPGKVSFEDQTANKGAALSPAITLPPQPGLTFWALLDVSPGAGIHQAGVDVVDATTKAVLATVWSKNVDLKSGTTGGKWLAQQATIPAALAGKSVRLRVWFDQLKYDTSNKQKLGLLVDELELTGTCP
jgi:hypothetical protein